METLNTQVTKGGKKKKEQKFVDSGATHNVFHRHEAFLSYALTKQKVVEVDHDSAMIVGKGRVRIFNDESVINEA